MDLHLPDPEELENEEERAILKCLHRLHEIADTPLRVMVTVTAVSRTTKRIMQRVPEDKRVLRLHMPAGRFLRIGFGSEWNLIWKRWYMGCIKSYADYSDIAFRIEPKQIWYPDKPPHTLPPATAVIIPAAQVGAASSRLISSDARQIALITAAFACDPVAWGLPPEYRESVHLDAMRSLIARLHAGNVSLDRWLQRVKHSRQALTVAVAIYYTCYTTGATASAPRGKLESMIATDASWFDDPISEAVDALCDKQDEHGVAAGVLVELVCTLLFELKIRHMNSRHKRYVAADDEMTARSAYATKVLKPINTHKRTRAVSRLDTEHMARSILVSVEEYSNIVSERAGAMARPYVRVIACSRNWMVLIHAAIHFLPYRKDVSFHFIACILPITGHRAVVVSAYADEGGTAGSGRLDLFVECYQSDLQLSKQLDTSSIVNKVRRSFFARSAQPYMENVSASSGFLRFWSFQPLHRLRFRIEGRHLMELVWARTERYILSILKAANERAFTVRVPLPRGDDTPKPVSLNGPAVFGAAVAVAGVASAKGGVARKFGKLWILAVERMVWGLSRPRIDRPIDVLCMRWMKTLLKCGSTSAYGYPLLKRIPDAVQLVVLREYLALRFGLPVRPVPSYGDVDIRYVFQSALPEINQLDPLVPREWWGYQSGAKAVRIRGRVPVQTGILRGARNTRYG